MGMFSANALRVFALVPELPLAVAGMMGICWGIPMHAKLRFMEFSLLARVCIDLLCILLGTNFVYGCLDLRFFRQQVLRDWAEVFETCWDRCMGIFLGFQLIFCGATSMVVGIAIDVFCLPLFGTTECTMRQGWMVGGCLLGFWIIVRTLIFITNHNESQAAETGESEEEEYEEEEDEGEDISFESWLDSRYVRDDTYVDEE